MDPLATPIQYLDHHHSFESFNCKQYFCFQYRIFQRGNTLASSQPSSTSQASSSSLLQAPSGSKSRNHKNALSSQFGNRAAPLTTNTISCEGSATLIEWLQTPTSTILLLLLLPLLNPFFANLFQRKQISSCYNFSSENLTTHFSHRRIFPLTIWKQYSLSPITNPIPLFWNKMCLKQSVFWKKIADIWKNGSGTTRCDRKENARYMKQSP